MNDEENLSENDKIRRKCIIDYVGDNPECRKEDVISYCTKIGDGSRVTLSDSIKDLIEEGIINEGKEKKNSKSYKLTLVSGNVLLTLPQDLESILANFERFIKAVKNKFKSEVNINDNAVEIRITRRFAYESKAFFLFLPYYLIEIINSLYTFYFNFMLPKKIKKRSIITRLYSTYFENLSKMHSMVLIEIIDDIPNSTEIAVKIKSKMYQGADESKYPELYPIYRTVRMCRINGLEEELYNILDLLWIKNEDACNLLYGLNLEPKTIDQNVSVDKDNKVIEDEYMHPIQKNQILYKIHLFIENMIVETEKGEEDAERWESIAQDSYNPYD